MKDDLEKFIHDQRDAFEENGPGPTVWEKLQSDLFGQPSEVKRKRAFIRRMSRSGKRWISAAAVLLLFISLAACIRTYQVKKQIIVNAIPADLQQAQAYYENQITIKITRIKSISSEQNHVADTSLWQLFGMRDAEYDRLRQALHQNPDNAHVRAAFVEYYRSRLEVLKGIENRMEEKQGRRVAP